MLEFSGLTLSAITGCNLSAAEADLVGSALLTAVTCTVRWSETSCGAK
jgi:hypothetical protein